MKNLHMKVTYGGQVPTVIDDEDLMYGIRPSATGRWRVVVRFDTDEFGGLLIEDEDGAALCWNDFVANEWVELFSTTPAALMRLALLLDAAERDAWFEHGPEDFAQRAMQFMHAEAVVPPL